MRIDQAYLRNIQRRIMEGRGQGEMGAYLPWMDVLHIHGTKGYGHRIKGWKTGRVHQLFSNLERDAFYVFEHSQGILDIREQYPLLPLKETVGIAEAQGLYHPIVPKTRNPAVMTTDFVLTIPQNIRTVLQARTVKPAKDLKGRALEKLEIERLYWKTRGIDWQIVTENEIPETFVRNMDIIHCSYWLDWLSPLTPRKVDEIESIIKPQVLQGTVSLREITNEVDRSMGLEKGSCLNVVYHLIANQRWHIDLHAPINPCEPLILLV